MVAGLPAQFLLLTWKNILLQRRKICVTVFEILLPLVFPIVLVIIRNLANLEPKLEEATTYEKERIDYYSSNQEILYAPNTTVISGIMNQTFSILKGFLVFLLLLKTTSIHNDKRFDLLFLMFMCIDEFIDEASLNLQHTTKNRFLNYTSRM